jgi:general secretion pathway protein C
MALMTRLQLRLVSLVLFALLCATLTYWFVTLSARNTTPLSAAAANATPVSVAQAAVLFGGQPDRGQNRDIHLSGILSLGAGRGAAAIVSMGDAPARAISLGGPIASGVTLSEVRARSGIVDRNGARSEIFLPANGAGPTIYVR